MLRTAIATALLCLFAAPAAAQDSDRRHIISASSPTGAPFSNGVLVGDTLYIAGHLGTDPATGNAATDPKIEAGLVMDAVKKTVEAAGLTMDDIVSVQVFCTDLALYDVFNTVYRGYFKQQFPARAFIGTNALVRGARFEVLGVAVRHAPPKGHARK